MSAEVQAKLERLRALLDDGLQAIVLRSPGMLAWLSAGGRSHIVPGDVGVASVIVTADELIVVTAVNEALRLQTEELGELDARWVVLPWWADQSSALPATQVGADVPYGSARDLSSELAAVRRQLLPVEVERLAGLGRDAAEAMTDACSTLTPDTTEFGVAALLAAQLWDRGMDHQVMLVCGAERLLSHRHPLPTDAAVGDLVMVVTCARRHGLITSLTRLVATRPVSAELRERYERLAHVDAAFALGTMPGTVVGDVFAAGVAAYADHGFEPAEWQRHHQGGPSGYAIRDYIATAGTRDVVVENQVFAWNPTAQSVKLEDTMLATSGGPRFITVDPRWPVIDVAGLRRPDILAI